MVKIGVLFEVRTGFLNIVLDELRLQRVNDDPEVVNIECRRLFKTSRRNSGTA
jgi:hypothetical protein